MINPLEPQQRSHARFHTPMVRFKDVVHIAVRSPDASLWQLPVLLSLRDRLVGGRIPIQRDLLRYPASLDRLLKQALGGRIEAFWHHRSSASI